MRSTWRTVAAGGGSSEPSGAAVAVGDGVAPEPSWGQNSALQPLSASALTSTIGTAINGRSGGLSAQLAVLDELMRMRYQGKVSIVDLRVDFEMIQDPRCRVAFQEIATTWTLPAVQVVALQEMAGAMLRASPQYRALAGLPASAAAEAQQRAAAACTRLRGPPVTSPPASSRG
jgi:hypothetical protein